MILRGDVREMLGQLADCSVDCVVTSPPYWGLRDYGTATWEGGDPNCDHLGSGTVGLVAQRHNRRWVGCELNPEYAKIAEARISKETNIFTEVS